MSAIKHVRQVRPYHVDPILFQKIDYILHPQTYSWVSKNGIHRTYTPDFWWRYSQWQEPGILPLHKFIHKSRKISVCTGCSDKVYRQKWRFFVEPDSQEQTYMVIYCKSCYLDMLAWFNSERKRLDRWFAAKEG